MYVLHCYVTTQGRVGHITQEAGAGTTMVEVTGWVHCPSCALVREGVCRQSGTWQGCKWRGVRQHSHGGGDWVDMLSLLLAW